MARASEHKMNFTKEQRKQFIENCVRQYIKNFPLEYMAICENVKRIRATRKDEKWNLFDKDSAYIRWTLRIPVRLFNAIDKNLSEPRFLEDDREIRWFKKTFPEFRTCGKYD